MGERINSGYTITDTIQIGEIEIVLGRNNSDPPMYVTWLCQDGSNYFWGHYFSDVLQAKKDWLDRAQVELNVQMRQVEQNRIGRAPEQELER